MKLKLFLLITCFVFCTKLYAQDFPFANEVKAFKHQDSLNFPKPGGYLFIGSSSIRMWNDLEQRFSSAPIIKRGVGGSELSQWVAYYSPYLVYPYKPARVYIYVGENDIAAGRSAKSFADDFSKLWEMIRQQLPGADIYWLSIKQSPIRAKSYPEVILANQLVKSFIGTKSKTWYVDFNTPVLVKATGIPDSSLFKPDYLHLNSKGYDKWQVALAPYMK
jgi:lysophospholipase L1-like esterase